MCHPVEYVRPPKLKLLVQTVTYFLIMPYNLQTCEDLTKIFYGKKSKLNNMMQVKQPVKIEISFSDQLIKVRQKMFLLGNSMLSGKSSWLQKVA